MKRKLGKTDKIPFDINEVIKQIRVAVHPYPRAAMFELAESGFKSVFQQLVGCIISIRTRDEVSLLTARRLLEQAPTPADMAKLSPDEIDDRIRACTFHEPKAKQIHTIAQRSLAEYGGELPCDRDVLMSFRGVGIKCANLVLGIACNEARISVDIHVQRVTNRWGYVQTPTPEKTTLALEKQLPKRYWLEINKLLVPFGKHICTSASPRCSSFPVLEMCRQVGVTTSR